jgi:phospholipase C
MATRSRWLGSALGACSIIAAANIVPSARAFGATATPVKHVVVIFQENESFDHYFATYPVALNPPNEPAFWAEPNTLAGSPAGC